MSPHSTESLPFEKVDVLVVGAGTAGLAAAITAARQGARTLLVERGAAPGGMASNALVHTLCGLYLLRNDETETLKYANQGFPKEFAERLIARGGASAPVRMGRLDVLPHEPAALAALADDMTSSTPHLTMLLHTALAGVEISGKRIQSARLISRGRTWEVPLHSLIDASGDAEAAALAGADFECAPHDRLQRPAYIFGIGGCAETALEGDAKLQLAHQISSAVMAGELSAGALGAAFRHGLSTKQIWATIDLQADPYDPCSPGCLTRLENEGRRLSWEILCFLRNRTVGFENAVITRTPSHAGIRESRRVAGRACLTDEDILQGRCGVDTAALAAWPLELRETAKGPRFRFPLHNRPAGIPVDCLRSRSFENLLVAGRCISCTHEAQASIRVTGTCMATGEAAGLAACVH